MPGHRLWRALTLGLPSASLTVVAIALLGPGADRPIEAAQLWGGPTGGVARLTFRVIVLDRFLGIDSPVEGREVIVRAWGHAGGPRAADRCRTRRDGTCDVELWMGASEGPLRAEVIGELAAPEAALRSDGRAQDPGPAAQGRPLAAGEVGRGDGWGGVPPRPARLSGRTRGELGLVVAARRGVFAVPFRDELVIDVTKTDGTVVAGAAVKLRADPADLEQVAGVDRVELESFTAPSGEVTFGITPRAHLVELHVEASYLALRGSFDGLLPVVPGAAWLDPAALAERKLRIVSPVPRRSIYATLASPQERLWGRVLELSQDERGFDVAELEWLHEAAQRGPLWLTLASDPAGSGSGTVGWPISSPGDPGVRDERRFRDVLLLDGMPEAERRHAERRRGAQRVATAALGAGALGEAVLLGLGLGPRGGRSSGWLLVAIATVIAAFAALGWVALWRMGLSAGMP